MTTLVFPPQFTFWQAMQRGMVTPMESPEYIRWLHTLPCAVTNTRNQTTVHHVVGHGLKGARKTCDFLAFPLEEAYHLPQYPNGIHYMGWKAWEEKHGSQLLYSLQTLLRAVHEGVIEFKPY